MNDFEVHPIGTAKQLRGGGGIDLYDPDGNINCELDGEPMAGVRYIGTLHDADGSHIVLIERDPTIAAHLAGAGLPEALPLVDERLDDSKKKNDVTGGRVRTGACGSSGDLKPVGNSEWPNSISLYRWAPSSLRIGMVTTLATTR